MRLGDIATYINGYAFKPSDWGDVGLPIIRIQDLTGSSYQLNYYSGKYPSKIEINNGDVLISWSASLGVYIWNGGKALLNQHIFKVVFDKVNISKQYFVYAVRYNLNVMVSKMHGATMKHIVKKDFDNIDILYPSIEKQNEIVDILTKTENLIAAYKQQLKQLDNLIKARFVEMFGDEKYPSRTVNELCTNIVDCPHTTPKYEGKLINPAIRTSEIKKGYIVWDSMRYVSDEEYEERVIRLRPQAGDIVYGREGAFGNAAILPKGYKFCLGQRVMLLRPNIIKCMSEYMLHAVISDGVYRQALEKNNASTVAHVNVKDVKNFSIPFPPLELQNQFAAFVHQVDKSGFMEENMQEYKYVTLRRRPELKNRAAEWFHYKWGVPQEAYLNNETEYGWYLCLDKDRIIGGLGVIENDFHDRKDLTPNVCAVYTEEEYRCKGIAGHLLNMVVNDLKSKAIAPIYLLTDHTGFYERYGWEFLCMVQGNDEPEMSRMYIHR